MRNSKWFFVLGLGLAISSADIASAERLTPRQMVLAARAAKITPRGNVTCSKILPLGGNTLYKRDASGHLANTNRAQACSLITGIGGPIYPSSVPLLNKNKVQISTFKAYQIGGYPFRYRAYTYGTSCASMAHRYPPPWYIAIGGGRCMTITNTTRSGFASH